MMQDDRLKVIQFATTKSNENEVIEDLTRTIPADGLSGLLFFCSTGYNLEKLGGFLDKSYKCPVTGCTTAGEISPDGYQKRGLTAVGFYTSELHMHPVMISPLADFDLAKGRQLAEVLTSRLATTSQFDPKSMFGLLLIDGLSLLEEQVAASIYQNTAGVSLIGGSAGDDLGFKHTYVYHGGKFHEDAAVYTLFETSLDFLVFKTQHAQPTDTKMVITEADPERRIVTEINGLPAAEAYAMAIGLSPEQLTPEVFSKHPVILMIGGEYFIRSIQKVNTDLSLSFFCAIDNGLVLTLGESLDLAAAFNREMQNIQTRINNLKLVIGCDCILRQLEITNKDLHESIRPALKDCGFIGFSTYGEQFNDVHVNQTLTGVALGG